MNITLTARYTLKRLKIHYKPAVTIDMTRAGILMAVSDRTDLLLIEPGDLVEVDVELPALNGVSARYINCRCRVLQILSGLGHLTLTIEKARFRDEAFGVTPSNVTTRVM